MDRRTAVQEESYGLTDFSHHMVDLRVEGLDAVNLLVDYSGNDYEDFEVGKTKQIVSADTDGYLIGDSILAGRSRRSSSSPGSRWGQLAPVGVQQRDGRLRRGARTVRLDPRRGGRPRVLPVPAHGPETDNVFDEVTKGERPDIHFFNFEEVTIDANDVYALDTG